MESNCLLLFAVIHFVTDIRHGLSLLTACSESHLDGQRGEATDAN